MASAAAASPSKPWRIIPRPLLETILNNHAQHHRVPQPLLLHGPRGVGKTTLFLHRLLENWNKGPHVTAYVDFAESVRSHHPSHGGSFPWSSWSSIVDLDRNSSRPPSLSPLVSILETELEMIARKGVLMGSISSSQVFGVLNKWIGMKSALERVVGSPSPKVSMSVLWDRAVFGMLGRVKGDEIEGVVGKGTRMSVEEKRYYKEGLTALELAKEVIRIQRGWRSNAVKELNRTGGFSRSLANSATDWPCVLLELLSNAAEIDHFQPKLVMNNIEVLKNAALVDDSTVCASMYHDSLIWRIIGLGANERCVPVILVTSDSYYSYRAFMDFGFPDIFVSRETFGWTPQEAKLHMVTDYFSASEWRIVAEVLGSNPRHLFELYALKQANHLQRMVDDQSSTFEDIVDAYLAHLQITVVNPGMDKASSLIEKFAEDTANGKISQDRLRFGAPWRHPPVADDALFRLKWAKLQLMDFVQSLVNTEFGLNYLADCSLEILDDPSAVAMLEVGLLYAQRDPSLVRPVSRGIERCLARWLVQEQIQLNFQESLRFRWHRIFRGRSYRHLMLQIGYK
ncbi:hypothetical protein AKJ16_DCAP17985 [Drosera capensis]